MASSNIAATKIIPASTTISPYNDDFNESKNFMRILFKPGYAVQGRELTQLQSILQNQIERFGNNIFKNGSIVLGGQSTIDTSVLHMNLASQFNGTDIVAGSFLDSKITYSSGNVQVQAVVVATSEKNLTDPPVLIIKYLSGSEFGNSSSILSTTGVYANTDSSNNFTGAATVASISDGIFFVNGFFVKVPAQTILISKFDTSANAKIGLEYSNDIVDSSSDSSLLDPALESSNYQAPGASRLAVNFNLALRDLDSEDDSTFTELLRIVNGQITRNVLDSQYAVLGDTLARRTYDQSGNYTVSPFGINVLGHPTDDTMVRAYFDPGKAYVKGYEFTSFGQNFLDIAKSRNSLSISNHPTILDYGNNIVLDDMRGVFDYTSGAVIDIHCITYPNINFTSNTTYSSTKIGTAKVRNVSYYGSSNTSNANTITYTMSIFDSAFSNLKSNAISSTANSITIYNPAGVLSSANGAYNNARLRVVSNTGTGQSYVISNWTAAGGVYWANTTTNIITPLDGTSVLSLDFDFTSAEAFTISQYTAGAPTARANADINIANKSSNQANGATYLSDLSLNLLIYPYPQPFINTGISGQVYTYWKKFTATFSSGSGTITVVPANESFSGASASGTSGLFLNNFIIIRNDNNLVVPVSSVTVTPGTGSATFAAADGTLGATCTVFASVIVSGGPNINPKLKTLVSTNTSIFTSATSNGSFIVDSSNTTVYLNSGQATIQNPNKNPAALMSLYTSDIRDIVTIYDLNGAALPAAGASLVGYADVTKYYSLNTGQKDSHYDHGGISLNPRVNSPAGPLIVCYEWYDRTQGATSDGLGYINIDSYPNVANTNGYSSIPSYTSSTGETLSLRDSIDFRPRRQNASNTGPNWTVQGMRTPVNGSAMETSYEYYIGRRDFIVLTTDLSNPFQLVMGTPAVYPQYPSAPDNSMILYKTYLEPYTMSYMNVNTTFVENKRYTMRDIGTLETRIENLEYYQTLSQLESSAVNISITDSLGIDRTKYGILAEDFSTHGIGDTNNPDYNCSINRAFGGLTPTQNTVALGLTISSNNSTVTNGTVVTLGYTETPCIIQSAATTSISVQPYQYAQFVGSIDMIPPSDNWVETSQAPDVIININGVNNTLVSNNVINTNRSNVRNNAITTTTDWYKTFFGTLTAD